MINDQQMAEHHCQAVLQHPIPAEKAAAYLSRLEADRRAAIAVSEAKAEEAKLVKARQEGFREALEILELQISTDNTEAEPVKSLTRRRRNIRQLIIHELSFSGIGMEKGARAGYATSAGGRRTRLAPPGMAPVLS
jgi:hypothetical protein